VIVPPSHHARATGNEPGHASVGATRGPRVTGLLTALAIGIGGALGALSRVGLDQWLGGGPSSTSTLMVTLVINTLGAFALGLLRRPFALTPSAVVSSGVSVGFLGAFTTWSAVMVHLALLQGAGSWLLGVGYLVATLALGLGGAWWGLKSGVGRAGGSS